MAGVTAVLRRGTSLLVSSHLQVLAGCVGGVQGGGERGFAGELCLAADPAVCKLERNQHVRGPG